MRVSISILGTLALLFASVPAVAQVGNDSVEESDVIDVVRGFYAALQAGDQTSAGHLAHPQAQLFVALEGPASEYTFASQAVAQFIPLALQPPTGWWTVEIHNPVVHVSGPVAVVWADFIYQAPRQLRCGTEAYQLLRTAEGWRIVSILNRSQQIDCETLKLAEGV